MDVNPSIDSVGGAIGEDQGRRPILDEAAGHKSPGPAHSVGRGIIIDRHTSRLNGSD